MHSDIKEAFDTLIG